jgi:predicted O-methyltransferase YrrM
MAVVNTASGRQPGLVLLFALTIFVSAFLLFQVQPMVGKFILPWFGGSPAVWTTAMLFFQSILFAGYVYAHLVASRLPPRQQRLVHVVVLALACAAALFVLPHAALKPTGDEIPVLRILLILALSVGLPYFCLATTGPLLQHWFTLSGSRGSVFRLYALSNVGSFLALFSFPYVFEPWLELPTIGRLWTAGFWVFAALCLASAILMARHAGGTTAPIQTSATPATSQAPSGRTRLAWVLLPALASLAFIATTDHLSHDIAPEPRVWITTLALYLLTFIIAFDNPRWYRPALTAATCLIAVLFLAGRAQIPALFGMHWGYGVSELRWLHYIALFLICLLCHGELYRRRPTDPKYLTTFYLWMSFGGACGGLFVTLVATNVLDDYYEWPLCLALAVLLACRVLWFGKATAAQTPGYSHGYGRSLALMTLSGLLIACAFWWDNPIRGRVSSAQGVIDTHLDQSRNFYGVVAVKERRFPERPDMDHRVFYSGQITHGIQYLSDRWRSAATTYYAKDSAVGETLQWAMERKPSLQVALIGLGAGTLATYARPSDIYDFFEINPEAVRVAETYFDNLSQAKTRQLRIILGDARLRIEQMSSDQKYDVIVLDAFSGGGVPVHLLTREAFKAYAQHLKPDGHIAINITNAYLNLYPVVKAQAQALGMGFRNKFQERDMARYVRENQWFVMSHDRDYFARYPSINRLLRDDKGRELGPENLDIEGVPLWTDHFSSLTPIEWRY